MGVIARVGLQAVCAPVSGGSGLAVGVSLEGDACVVLVSGELDLATRNTVFLAATEGQHRAMVVDLTGVTFMDCAGYGCLAACRLVLEGSGRTLTVRGQNGQPARLLAMIAELAHTTDAIGLTVRSLTLH